MYNDMYRADNAHGRVHAHYNENYIDNAEGTDNSDDNDTTKKNEHTDHDKSQHANNSVYGTGIGIIRRLLLIVLRRTQR